MRCKVTNQIMDPFMSFGKMPLANGFIKKNQFNNEFFYQMEVGFSKKISLFQLNKHPEPENMFNEKYPFYTGSSKFMINHFKNYSYWIKKKFLKSGSKLIEIGSNDGTFLNNFKNNNIQYLGFEPSKNVFQIAKKNKIKIINNFFNKNNIKKRAVKKFWHKTDVICASNVICHIPDLKNLIETVDQLLTSEGVFVFEEPYLGSMFEKVSYDQIYDEHIFMFSATSIKKIFEMYDFDLVDACLQETHGGSMRYIIKRKNKFSPTLNLRNILKKEKEFKLDSIESCLNFKKNCEISKIKINNKIKKIKENGKSICGYAATSKSTTILNYCGINKDQIDYICDTTKEKIGKYSPGTHIPIKDMNYFYKNQPDTIYLFAWNHKKEILRKEKNFKGEWFSHVKL